VHRHTRHVTIAAALTGSSASAISMIGAGTPSLWGDEAASVLSAERSVPSLLSMLQHVDAVHGLYYLALHFWIQVAGTSPFAVRAPSAVAIGACVAGIVVLGSTLRGVRFGVIAGTLCAVLPRLTDVGSEARSYAFTAAVATWLTVIVVRILRSREPRTRLWVCYGVLLAIGTWLFIYLALIAVAHLAVLLASPRRATLARPALVAIVIAFVATTPLFVLAYLERGQVAYLASRDYHDPTSLFVSPFFENLTVAMAAWVLITVGVALSIWDWRTGWHRWQVPTASSVSALIPVAWLLVPAAILIGSSTVIADYTPRYLAMCAPAAGLLMAVPVDALAGLTRHRWAGALGGLVVVVAVVAIAVPVWVHQRGPYAKNDSDWAAISAEVAAHASPGDAVAFDDSVRPSRKPRLAFDTYPQGFRGLRDPTLRTGFQASPTWYDQVISLTQAQRMGRLVGVSTLWMVEYATAGHVDQDGIAALRAAGFREVGRLVTHRSVILEFHRG